MKLRLTDDFISRVSALPDHNHIKARPQRSYRLWLENLSHPGLQFKQAHPREPIYSVCVGNVHTAQ